MSDAELLFRPVHELAALVRNGELSARELVELSLARIDELDGELNAFVEVDGERALADADAIGSGDERPFAGVPIAIKNNRAVSGWKLTYAAELFGDFRPDYDHNVVRRLREAGFVVVGTTNLPEYGILPVSEPRRFGPARNPWDTERTPGGSSGGSAAAVAAGMVPIAHGNDGGGSTRIPAACCGLVGLKPSRGRISWAPELGDQFISIDGVLTRTVGETAALLDVLEGYEPGDATWATPPAQPYAEAAADEPGRLRVGLALNPPLPDCEVDETFLRAARDTAELLSAQGHEIEEFEPPWTNEAALPIFSAEFGAMIAMSIAYSGLIAGRDPQPEDMQRLSWALYEAGRGLDSIGYLLAHGQLQAYARQIVAAMAPYDVVITPALAQRPLPVGALDPDAEDPLATFGASGLFTPFTAAINATGQPAISLPLFQGDDGLPTGVQLIGRPEGEDVLLSVSAQLEAARPWAERRAPVSVS